MNSAKSGSPVSPPVIPQPMTVRLESPHRFWRFIAWGLLAASLLLNAWFLLDPLSYSRPAIHEQHVTGKSGAANRIAIINVEGTISPPFTERWLRQIKQAREDDSIKGVILAIDSPGGFVADSHQLHREISKLVSGAGAIPGSTTSDPAGKPVWVAMKRIAASGGYYIAMAVGPEGRIYAEPTTWTGSIGVIIPRYNAAGLSEKLGVTAEPLVTGPLKDTLSPFRDMTEQEQSVWGAILEDSFDRFVGVIDDCRTDLDEAAVRKLATGQIYTARQALDSHLVDRLGYVEDAAAELAGHLGLAAGDWEAFEYRSTPGLVDSIIGVHASVPSLSEQLLDAGVPKALYYASWAPLPAAASR
jgi:protease-4